MAPNRDPDTRYEVWWYIGFGTARKRHERHFSSVAQAQNYCRGLVVDSCGIWDSKLEEGVGF